MARFQLTRSSAVVELIRLCVVIAFTGLGFEVGGAIDGEQAPLLGALFGALIGYLAGGIGGRRLLVKVDETQERLRRVESSELIAGVVGSVLGVIVSTALVLPLALLPGRAVTIPIGIAVILLTAYAGMRIGASRAGDLGRFVGVRGRLEVSSPSRGGGAKVVDSSALIDGRLLDVARAGFVDGALIVPQFVLHELQGLADSGDRRRRRGGRQGLDVLSQLQQEHLVVVEITDDDPTDVHDVDAKLARIARDRDAGLVTTDSGLAQVAEIAGIRVLDLNQLAEAVRPPAIPGQRMEVEILREGQEEGQGIAYLRDGTMVVVEHAADRIGSRVLIEVTSINQTRRGRMLFGTPSMERRGSERAAQDDDGDDEADDRADETAGTSRGA